MTVVYVSVLAQTSTPTTMETQLIEFANLAALIATNAQVSMDAHNALIINLTKQLFRQMVQTRQC
jgi:hypothetical protein